MTDSNFSFIGNYILRQNLDESFDHILTLLPFTESTDYNEPAKSAFRKTIIIYTASIVEALLFYVLDTEFSDDDIAEFYGSWELKEKKVLYSIDESTEIVAGMYRKVPGKGGKTKMNLGQIMDFLKTKNVLNASLYASIESIKKLRNEQHIGTHKKVPVYGKEDLEGAFAVAREVKDFVSKRYLKEVLNRNVGK